MGRLIRWIGTGFVWIISLSIGYGQCVMCKSTVVASESKWYELAKALNNGILYLFAIPYLLAAFFGIWWYRQYKKLKEGEGKEESSLPRRG